MTPTLICMTGEFFAVYDNNLKEIILKSNVTFWLLSLVELALKTSFSTIVPALSKESSSIAHERGFKVRTIPLTL